MAGKYPLPRATKDFYFRVLEKRTMPAFRPALFL
jgi:hypothetical protein